MPTGLKANGNIYFQISYKHFDISYLILFFNKKIYLYSISHSYVGTKFSEDMTYKIKLY